MFAMICTFRVWCLYGIGDRDAKLKCFIVRFYMAAFSNYYELLWFHIEITYVFWHPPHWSPKTKIKIVFQWFLCFWLQPNGTFFWIFFFPPYIVICYMLATPRCDIHKSGTFFSIFLLFLLPSKLNKNWFSWDNNKSFH